MHICGYFAASETRLMNIKQHTRSECLTCTFRASCCSARLSRPSPVPLSGTGYNTPAPSLLLFLESTLIPRVYTYSSSLLLFLESTLIPRVYLFLKSTLIPRVYSYSSSLLLFLESTLIPRVYSYSSSLLLFLGRVPGCQVSHYCSAQL